MHPACCGLCALHAQPPCKVTYRKDACAGALLNPITDSDVNSATGISASIALTVSGVADSQSVHLEGGTTTRLRRSSPGRWNRPMIGCPSALMVSIENDTTISPVARSVQRSQIAATVNGSPSWRWILHGTALPVSQHGSKNRSTGTRQNCCWRHAVRYRRGLTSRLDSGVPKFVAEEFARAVLRGALRLANVSHMDVLSLAPSSPGILYL